MTRTLSLVRRPPLTLAIVLAGLALAIPSESVGQGFSIQGTASHATGSGPSSVVLVDLNGDDLGDLVTANFNAGSVSVLLSDGLGAFHPAVSYSVESGPVAVTLRRVDGDTLPDLVIANQTANSVSVLLNIGSGVFGAAMHFPTGMAPSSVMVISDDIYVTNSGDDTFSILPGDGFGGFGAKTDFPTGGGPSGIDFGIFREFEGEAVVVLNQGDNTVSVHRPLSDCANSYLRTDYPTGAAPRGLAIGDLNGDAKRDIVTANFGANTFSVLMNDGGWGFRAATHYATGSGPTSIAVHDLNLDGALDVVTCNETSNSVSIFLGDGNGGFAPRTDVATGGNPRSVGIGWVDEDGEWDIVTANFGTGDVSVLQGDLPGGFALGETAVELSGLDQNGVLQSVAAASGKWRVIDLCASWCGPCQIMADGTQQAYDSWDGHATVDVEYFTVLTEGNFTQTSNQAFAQSWAVDNSITRPIIHGAGNAYLNYLTSWYHAIVRENAGAFVVPTVVFLDPAGTISFVNEGAMTAQEIIDKITDLAGIGVSPPLAPAPPPVAPFPPVVLPLNQQSLSSTVVEFTKGAMSWSAALPNQGPVGLQYGAYVSAPVPWMASPLDVLIRSIVDPIGGVESFRIEVYTSDFGPVSATLPMDVRLTSMVWPDGAERELAPSSSSDALSVHSSDQVCYEFFPTGLSPAATLVSSDLSIAPFDFGGVGGLPPDDIGFYIEHPRTRHTGVTAAPVVGPAKIASLQLTRLGEHPVRDVAQLAIDLAVDDQLRLDVYDVSGRRIQSLWNGPLPAGRHILSWDGRGQGNRSVASGVYLLRATGSTGTATTRVVWLR